MSIHFLWLFFEDKHSQIVSFLYPLCFNHCFNWWTHFLPSGNLTCSFGNWPSSKNATVNHILTHLHFHGPWLPWQTLKTVETSEAPLEPQFHRWLREVVAAERLVQRRQARMWCWQGSSRGHPEIFAEKSWISQDFFFWTQWQEWERTKWTNIGM